MEQIKDMVTLRAFAYDQAMRHGAGATATLNIAKDIESYILGDAKLPESYEDKTMDVYKDFMNEIAPKTPTWFKPTEMLPKDGQDVLVLCEGMPFPMMGEYLGNGDWEVYNADIRMFSSEGECSIEAWCLIPEYNGKAL